MTGRDENPYRFVEAREQEESADAPPVVVEAVAGQWDLRSYVEPASEPVFAPDEIAELGMRWSGFAILTFVDLATLSAILFLFLPVAPTPAGPGAETLALGCVLPAVLGLRMTLWGEAYRLLCALRYAPPSAALAATLYALPVANLTLLFVLKNEAVATLRRHGIPASFWLVDPATLPRQIEEDARSGR